MTAGNEVLAGAPAPGQPLGPEAPGSGPGTAGGRPAGRPGVTARARRPGRAGAGGRWLIWPLRVVLWTVVLLVGYRGIAAIVSGAPEPGAARAGSAGQGPGGFPVALAEAYALEFGQVYLNFSPASAAQRAAALAQFLPAGADPQLGWDGVGVESAQAEQVAGIRVIDPHRAVVTLLARVNGRLAELGVPVYAARGGLVVSGPPALLPPPRAVTPPRARAVAADPAVAAALRRRLPGFFRAFASGQAARLRAFTGGARFGGLGGAVVFGGLVQLSVPRSGGATRQITVTVVWRTSNGLPGRGAPTVTTAPAQIEMTYAMTVARRGATWYVRSIGAAPPWPGR